MTKNYRFLGLHLVTAQSKKVKVESSSNHVAQAARRPALFRLSWVLLAGNDTGFSPFCALQNVAFFSHYFTARFISCSDTFVSIYPRLPLSYHESALDPKELQHFCCFNQHFPMVFPWFSHGFPNVFPWFSHFPMVFPSFSHDFPIFPWFSPWFLLTSSSSVAVFGARTSGISRRTPPWRRWWRTWRRSPRNIPTWRWAQGESHTRWTVPDLEEVHVCVKYMYDYVGMYVMYVCMYIYIYMY